MKSNIKSTMHLALLSMLVLSEAFAQPMPPRPGPPLSISLFAESISLPTLRNIQKGGFGLKIGTELYYRNRRNTQVFQGLSLGYYHHPQVQRGLFLSTGIGYRRFAGGFFVDALVGGGALLLRPVAPSYTRDETGNYHKAGATQLKFMPTLQTGFGYRLPNRTLFFARYEVFGELPFRFIVLPHQSFSVGTQFSFTK